MEVLSQFIEEHGIVGCLRRCASKPIEMPGCASKPSQLHQIAVCFIFIFHLFSHPPPNLAAIQEVHSQLTVQGRGIKQ